MSTNHPDDFRAKDCLKWLTRAIDAKEACLRDAGCESASGQTLSGFRHIQNVVGYGTNLHPQLTEQRASLK